MLYSSKNRKKEKSSIPEIPEENLGKNISLSSLDDINCKQYIGPVNRNYTERINYSGSKRQEKMKSVKKSQTSEKKNSPNKVSQIKMDTGLIEIGYDEKDKQTIFSFVRDKQIKKNDRVIEKHTKFKKVHNNEKFYSNEKSFTLDSVEFRTKYYKSRSLFNEQFEELSRKNDGDTTVDKVIPFKNTNYEKRQRDLINENKNESNINRSEKHTAMSMLSNLRQIKDYKKMQLEEGIRKAILEAREEINSNGIINDDYIIYLKKKWLTIQNNNKPIEYSNVGFNEKEDLETNIPKTFDEKTNLNNSEDKNEKVFADGDENPNNNANSKDNVSSFKKVIEEITNDSEDIEDNKDELNHSVEVDDSE